MCEEVVIESGWLFLFRYGDMVQDLFEKGKITRESTTKIRKQINLQEALSTEESEYLTSIQDINGNVE